MDSEHIKTQYLSLSMFVVLPMQHISLRGLGGGNVMMTYLRVQTWSPYGYFFFFFLAQYILFHLSFTALRLHDRVDLCKDHLSLHGITIFFACWDLLGLQGDYFIFLTPPARSAFIFSIRQYLVRHWTSAAVMNPCRRIYFHFLSISQTPDSLTSAISDSLRLLFKDRQ